MYVFAAFPFGGKHISRVLNCVLLDAEHDKHVFGATKIRAEKANK